MSWQPFGRIKGNAEEPITRRGFVEAVQLLGRALGLLRVLDGILCALILPQTPSVIRKWEIGNHHRKHVDAPQVLTIAVPS